MDEKLDTQRVEILQGCKIGIKIGNSRSSYALRLVMISSTTGFTFSPSVGLCLGTLRLARFTIPRTLVRNRLEAQAR